MSDPVPHDGLMVSPCPPWGLMWISENDATMTWTWRSAKQPRVEDMEEEYYNYYHPQWDINNEIQGDGESCLDRPEELPVLVILGEIEPANKLMCL